MFTIKEIQTRKQIGYLYLSLLILEQKIMRLNSKLEKISSKYYKALNGSDLNYFFEKFNKRRSIAKKIKSEFNSINKIDKKEIESSISHLEKDINEISTSLLLYLANKV